MKDTIIIFFLAKETFDKREKCFFFKTDTYDEIEKWFLKRTVLLKVKYNFPRRDGQF